MNPSRNQRDLKATHKLPRLVTYNIRSLCSLSTKKAHLPQEYHKLPQPKQATATQLKALAKSHQIILLQETQLPPDSSPHSYLNNLFPNWTVFHNNHPITNPHSIRPHHGTAILLSPELMAIYHTTPQSHTIIIPGRIQQLTLYRNQQSPPYDRATSGIHPLDTDLTITNCYLSAVSHKGRRLNLKKLEATPPPHPHNTHILAGDFNFVEALSDTVSRSAHYIVPKANKDLWSRIKTKLNLIEIPQSLPTYYTPGTTSTTPPLSRLDRVYLNMRPSFQALYQPRSCIPHVQFPPYTRTGRRLVSDHAPVSLSFNYTVCSGSRPQARRSSPRVPDWITTLPNFAPLFRHHLASSLSRQPQLTPWQAWTQVKKSIGEASRIAQQLSTAHRKHPKHIITLSIKLLGLIHNNPPNFQAINATYHKLPPTYRDTITYCPTTRTFNTNHFTTKLDHLLKTWGYPDDEIIDIPSDRVRQLHSGTPISVHTPPRIPPRQETFIKKAKSILPSTRSQLQGIKDSSSEPSAEHHNLPLLTNPHKMAHIAKAYWGKLWNQPPTTQPHIQSFLKHYHKRITLRQLQPSLNSLISVIKNSGNSSPGPDGIRFNVYRHLQADIAPYLHRLILDLGKGNYPPVTSTFNHSTLYLLPKKDTQLIHDTRPIQVPNTDNRLISSLLCTYLTTYTVPFISKFQQALPQRQAANNIIPLNTAFYEALGRKRQRFLLLIDFSKAFDSLSQTYVASLLVHIGLTSFWRNVFAALVRQVTAHFTFGTHTGISTTITSGVKQGDPSSPIIFCLSLDPLLTYLTSNQKIERIGGFMDDVSIFFSCLTLLTALHPLFHKFGLASGLRLNLTKTHLLPTLPLTPPESQFITRSSWSEIRISNSSKYLGVLFGREATPTSNFAKPVDKLVKRVNSFLPTKNSFSLQQRIVIANIFLIPILSYIYQFFHIPATYHPIIHNALRAWLIPLHTGCSLLDLQRPWHWGGFHTPLRDYKAHNLASLYKQYQHHTANRHHHPTTNTSLMASHFKFAALQLSLHHLPNNTIGVKPPYLHLINLTNHVPRLSKVLHKNRKIPLPFCKPDLIHNNLTSLHPPPPTILLKNFFRLLHNTFYTQTRVSYLIPASNSPCVFCHGKNQDIYHQLGCPTVTKILQRLHGKYQLAPIPHTLQAFLLLLPLTPQQTITSLITISTIWRTILDLLSFRSVTTHKKYDNLISSRLTSWMEDYISRSPRRWFKSTERNKDTSGSKTPPKVPPKLTLSPATAPPPPQLFAPRWDFSHISTRKRRHPRRHPGRRSRRRLHPSSYLYKVHWTGYSPTWEPYDIVKEFPDSLRHFNI